jgi:hypothetical protein
VIGGSGILALFIYFGYIFHVNSLLQESYKMMQNTERDAEEARKRFGDYREIDIKFKKPMTTNEAADHARLERI